MQGCAISQGLYNIYSEHIMRCVLEEHHDGITIGGRRDTNLRFANYTILLCTCNDELLAMLKRLKEAIKSQNLLSHKGKISWRCTKAAKRKRTSCHMKRK